MGCVIEGKQCTSCCEAIMLNVSRDHLAGRKGDPEFILENWKPISKRRAKKINPYMIKEYHSAGSSYWSCKNVTKSGCGIYEKRGQVCSGYPLYEQTIESFARGGYRKPEYHAECTEWPLINAVTI